MKREFDLPEILPADASHKDLVLASAHDTECYDVPVASYSAAKTLTAPVVHGSYGDGETRRMNLGDRMANFEFVVNPMGQMINPDKKGDGGERASPANAGTDVGWSTAVAVADLVIAGSDASGATYLVRAPAFDDLRALAVRAGPDSLPFYAAHYLDAKVIGGSPHTLDAKSPDLKAFIAWFAKANSNLVAHAWRPRDTRRFLGQLLGRGLAPTTINRMLATLRHFARWLQDDHALFGTLGLPTKDVKDVPTEEFTCKKLSDEEVRALFKAAEDRVMLLDAKRAAAAEDKKCDPTRRARPRRDLAMIALLYYCGLRASEQMMLRRDQYSGTHIYDVARKGRNVTRRLFLPIEGRRMLDDYIASERPRDDVDGTTPALFVSTGGNKGYLLRTDLADAMARIASEANKHRPSHKQIHVTPHKWRHTFGARIREKTGSDSETAAALGHQSIKYVPRYARKTDDEREAMIQAALEI